MQHLPTSPSSTTARKTHEYARRSHSLLSRCVVFHPQRGRFHRRSSWEGLCPASPSAFSPTLHPCSVVRALVADSRFSTHSLDPRSCTLHLPLRLVVTMDEEKKAPSRSPSPVEARPHLSPPRSCSTPTPLSLPLTGPSLSLSLWSLSPPTTPCWLRRRRAFQTSLRVQICRALPRIPRIQRPLFPSSSCRRPPQRCPPSPSPRPPRHSPSLPLSRSPSLHSLHSSAPPPRPPRTSPPPPSRLPSPSPTPSPTRIQPPSPRPTRTPTPTPTMTPPPSPPTPPSTTVLSSTTSAPPSRPHRKGGSTRASPRSCSSPTAPCAWASRPSVGSARRRRRTTCG